MEPPIQHHYYAPTVKCSFCAADIDVSAVAEHECLPASPDSQSQSLYGGIPTQSHETQNDLHSIATFPSGGRRPVLPKIDSSVTGRSGLRPSEAASIAHDLGLPSPVSAGSSGHGSPRRSRSRSRRARSPRPPSPDGPISQDCAFPPFPMKPKRSQPTKSVHKHKPHSASRSTTSTNTYQHSSSQSNASSIYSAGSGPVKRRTSNTSSRQRSRQGTRDDSISSASTTPSSPRQSAMASLSRQQSIDQSQRPPALVLTDSYTSEPGSTISTMPPTPSWPHDARTPSPKILLSPNSEAGWVPTESAIPEEQVPEMDGSGPTKATHNKLETFDRILPPENLKAEIDMFDNPPREPMYKMKRPPPLLQPTQQIESDPRMPLSARAPAPPPSNGGLARSLTNLFSRKRSTSSAPKQMPQPSLDSPRMRALAPDPPERPKRGDSLWDDAGSHEDAAPWSSSSPQEGSVGEELSIDRTAHDNSAFSERSQQTHHTKTALTNDSTDFDFDLGRRSPMEGDHGDKIEHQQGDYNDSATTVPTFMTARLTTPDEDARRASIDSASSYGSIGFSNKTESPRSSHPVLDDTRRRMSLAPETGAIQTTTLDFGRPPRPHLHELIPDSPTDPAYHAGKLTPVFKSEPVHKPQAEEVEKQLHDVPLPPTPKKDAMENTRIVRPETPAGVRGKCRGCSGRIVTGQKSVSSADGRLSGKYHKECFVCRTCKAAFATADFYVFEDHPYCAHHYHVLNNTLCTGCGKGIEGQYLETFDVTGSSSKKFHHKCLSCATCKVQLHEDYFEFQGRVYCEKDAFRATNAPRNPYDTVPSRPSPLVRELISSEEPGVRGRFPERRTTRLIAT